MSVTWTKGTYWHGVNIYRQQQEQQQQQRPGVYQLSQLSNSYEL